MKFGEHIKQLREQNHLLQRQLANALDMDTAMLSKIERGERRAKREHIPVLASLLKTNEKELSEERRLAYVGITRARERLYVTRSVTRSVWGAPSYNPSSRFLDEIPASLISWQRLEPMNQPVSSGGFGAAPAMSRASKPKEPKQYLILNVADKVLHERFGLGTVTETGGNGDSAEATIDFGSSTLFWALHQLKAIKPITKSDICFKFDINFFISNLFSFLFSINISSFLISLLLLMTLMPS